MIFEFYWSCYDGRSSYLFEGQEKTKEEFQLDCKKAMVESFSGYIKSLDEDDWAGLNDWVDFAAKKLEDYGYKRIFPTSFGYFGYLMPGKDDKNSYKDVPELKKQMKKMEKHNKRVEKLLYD